MSIDKFVYDEMATQSLTRILHRMWQIFGRN